MIQLQEKIYSYFHRDPQLRVLFIFDNGFKREELKDVEWEPEYKYVEFKGDWFTMKYNIENEWKDQKVILVLQMGSPFITKQFDKFPLMDLLTANMEFHDLDYLAFMQQHHIPDSLAEFVRSNIEFLQMEKFIKLFAADYAEGSFSEDKAIRGFISSFLNSSLVLDWETIIVRFLILSGDKQKCFDFIRRLKTCPWAKKALDIRLKAIFGTSYNADTTDFPSRKVIEVFKYNAITQSLAPSSADNYRKLRVEDSIALQRMNLILELALSQPKTAVPFIDVFTKLGEDVREDEIIRWYGADASYYFVPEMLCIPIIKMLVEEKLETQPEAVIKRLEDFVIKHSDNGDMRAVINYLIFVANFYLKVADFGSFALDTANDFVNKYETDLHLFDMLYRQSLEAFFNVDSTAPLYDTILAVKNKFDINYHKMSNRLNLEWTRCIKQTGGFATLTTARQHTFYNTYIKNATKKQVVIVSDALRYEVAMELLQELAKKKHVAKVVPNLAMLPTETKFCKPSLLPHDKMRMVTVSESEQDLEVDGMNLTSKPNRSKQLALSCPEAICMNFDDIKYDKKSDRESFKHRLVYVYHDNIDKVGHDGTSKQIVEACRNTISDLARFIAYLHDAMNVTEVFVTSDHGFLFNDIEFADKDKLPVNEETMERKSRYYIAASDTPQSGIVKFPLDEVSAMQEKYFIAVPEGTNRLAAQGGGYMFTHGGAALQEMVTPVLISRYERENAKEKVGVMVLKQNNLVITSSRLKFTLLQTEAVSMEYMEREVSCALYYNNEIVSPEFTVMLNKTDALLDSRRYTIDLTLNRSIESKVLQLRIYDTKDKMNPIVSANVINKTSIEMDDF